MDIYGVKKNILELEQVFLDMTKVLVGLMYTSIQLIEPVYLWIRLRSLKKTWLSTIYLDDGIQYKSIR